jgi:hypothetical protein
MKLNFDFLTDHIRNNDNPQTYLEHGRFAFTNSLILLWGGLIGIVHAIFPWWFPFATSSIVIASMRKLIDSGRHRNELQQLMPGYILEKHIK